MKKVVVFFEILTTLLLLAIPVLAQTCADTVFLPDTTLSNRRILRIPVTLANPCPVGGFNMIITTSDPNILKPDTADTLGSRLCFHTDTTLDSLGQPHVDTLLPWEYFYAAPGVAFPESLYVAGVANWPDAESLFVPPLDTGSGAIFYAMFEVPCSYMPAVTQDTSIELRIEQVFVTNPSGDNHQVIYYNGQVFLHFGAALRGDANCDGQRRGSDVTYLVAFFKGQTGCPYTIRNADANADGRILGSDVTYLVRFFKGLGPEPPE